MQNFLFELLGTAFLILLGDGVVANVVLSQTKGHNSGWIVITLGWAMAVFTGVYIAAPHSGAYLNPAVSIALAASGKFAWDLVPVYIAGQFIVNFHFQYFGSKHSFTIKMRHLFNCVNARIGSA